jgi:hypothetical protein
MEAYCEPVRELAKNMYVAPDVPHQEIRINVLE